MCLKIGEIKLGREKSSFSQHKLPISNYFHPYKHSYYIIKVNTSKSCLLLSYVKKKTHRYIYKMGNYIAFMDGPLENNYAVTGNASRNLLVVRAINEHIFPN